MNTSTAALSNATGMSKRPALGLWMTIALVVGNMIGSGIFLLPSALAGFGGAAFYGWGLSAAGAMLVALVFARLGLRHPMRGGPYAYARLGFGNATGFAVAWSYWIGNWCGNAAIAVAFAGYVSTLLPGVATPFRGALLAAGVLWFTTLLNLFGARNAGRSQLILTIAKLLPLAVLIVIGVWAVKSNAWHPFNRSHDGWLAVATSTAALAMWAFLGVECATIPAADVRDPERNIPRATIIGTLLGIVFTISACMIVVGLLPQSTLAASTAPFADAARLLWGGAAGVIFSLAAALSCLGALNGWTLMQGQLSLAMADDGLFPEIFARCDARGTPWAGILISSALSTALLLSNYQRSLVGLFTFFLLLSTATTLFAYLVCSAASLRLRERSIRDVAGTAIAVGALFFSVLALVGTGVESLLWGAALLIAGAPLYLWLRLSRKIIV